MVNLIDQKVLQADTDLPDARDMEERVLNEITQHIMTHPRAPRYLYINERTWALTMHELINWTDEMEMEVIATKFQPPRVAWVDDKRYSYREIAEESQRRLEDEKESIARGLLNIL